jgi:2-polyprenyl-3-methyl-5-hydroxy-6-metoxy-1,4-benzoquinol methylase
MNNIELSQRYDMIYKKGIYREFFTFSSFPTQKLIVDMIPDWNGLSVVDIGCGEGSLAAMLSFAGAGKVDAVDYSSEAIKIAKNRINIENVSFASADYREIKRRYDVIVMNGVLEHFDEPFKELKYMIDTNLKDNGIVITASPSFLNPRGYVWMALQLLLDIPMSLSDLHFLCHFDFEDFCKQYGYALKFKSIDQDWGAGERTIIDFKKRLKNALRDANMKNANVDKFLSWLQRAVKYFRTNEVSGATVIYKIMKNNQSRLVE